MTGELALRCFSAMVALGLAAGPLDSCWPGATERSPTIEARDTTPTVALGAVTPATQLESPRVLASGGNAPRATLAAHAVSGERLDAWVNTTMRRLGFGVPSAWQRTRVFVSTRPAQGPPWLS